MSIVLVRIDDRLVHGQIVQGWLKTIDIDAILVVSDSAAKDKMQQTLMKMALPNAINLYVKSLKDATTSLKGGYYDKENIMILAAHPSDILYMMNEGVKITSLNIGGMHFINGKKQLFKNICVDNEDIKNLHRIYSKGVEVENRILPEDEKSNVMNLLEKEYQNICETSK
ncbi:MAG: PTS sugar transporter subunit IIB [Endomicrobium sp.]|jgi:PTS system mannose-specific IIB component|nr:PTS sugar transporter subunit IIB [Endomicrobium sp.]